MNEHVIEYYRLRLMASIRRNKMYLCYSNGVILTGDKQRKPTRSAKNARNK